MKPEFTVLIPTWNRGRHLLPTLRSALAQDYPDFEIIICGDGCSDDTEAQVRPFLGERLRWLNLMPNRGSQAFANNAGIAAARGNVIAYLGHDDIWAPWHLREMARVLADDSVDVAVAGGFFHGPEGSRHVQVTGLFGPDGEASLPFSHFLPPPSLAHRKHAADRVGGWGVPWELRRQVDRDFQLRLAGAGCRFRSTGKVSLHKFAASDRYLYYLNPSSDEQARMLARFSRKGHDRWVAALLARAKREGRFNALLQEEEQPVGFLWSRSRQARGAMAPVLQPLEKGVVIAPDDVPRALDWHGLEQGRYRWSGPSPRPKILLPVTGTGTARVELEVVMRHAASLASFAVRVNGADVAWELADGHIRFTAKLRPDRASLIELHAPTRRADDIAGNGDARRIGIAIGNIRLSPLAG